MMSPTCSICFCAELVENSYTLPCRHRFCRECVQAYAENKIGDNLLEMTCPDFATPAQVYLSWGVGARHD